MIASPPAAGTGTRMSPSGISRAVPACGTVLIGRPARAASTPATVTGTISPAGTATAIVERPPYTTATLPSAGIG